MFKYLYLKRKEKRERLRNMTGKPRYLLEVLPVFHVLVNAKFERLVSLELIP